MGASAGTRPLDRVPAVCARKKRVSARACTTTGSSHGRRRRSTGVRPSPARARCRRDRRAVARSTPSGRDRGTARSGRSSGTPTRSGRRRAPPGSAARTRDRWPRAARSRARRADAPWPCGRRARRGRGAAFAWVSARRFRALVSRRFASLSNRGSLSSQRCASKNRTTDSSFLIVLTWRARRASRSPELLAWAATGVTHSTRAQTPVIRAFRIEPPSRGQGHGAGVPVWPQAAEPTVRRSCLAAGHRSRRPRRRGRNPYESLTLVLQAFPTRGRLSVAHLHRSPSGHVTARRAPGARSSSRRLACDRLGSKPVLDLTRPGWRRRLTLGVIAVHRALYRASGGRLLGRVAGMPVLLLTTTGRRTGRSRTTPLTYLRDGDALVLVASAGGSDRPPAWSLNLDARSRCRRHGVVGAWSGDAHGGRTPRSATGSGPRSPRPTGATRATRRAQHGRSRCTCSSRTGRRTDEAPARARASEAAGQGLEPQLPEPESGVLPLDDPAGLGGL